MQLSKCFEKFWVFHVYMSPVFRISRSALTIYYHRGLLHLEGIFLCQQSEQWQVHVPSLPPQEQEG